MKAFQMTKAQAEDHQKRHGFSFSGPVNAIKQGVPIPIAFGPRMNRTEAEYALILEAMKRRGEIHAWFFEGITLHWGGGMRYTADFVVYRGHMNHFWRPLLIEIKGGHIWSRDSVRFRGCAAEWGEYYDFEMHQKKNGEWRRIR